MLRLARIAYRFNQAKNTIYDVAVIGGGSGGLAFALEGAKIGLKIAVFDYVTPSHQGTTWGLGGTCVNVGCIPKKLFHQSSLIKEQMEGSGPFGWNPGEQHQVEWTTLMENIQNHIKGLNHGYKGNLKSSGILYLNKLARFKDENTLEYGSLEEFQQQQLNELKFKYCVISTGGRPTKLKAIEQYAITSDDIFSQEKPPGKTLVVGGGYIALECAGFLKGLGYDVTLMTRGKYLREFDQDVVGMILNHYEKHLKVKIIPESLPYHSEKINDQIVVKWKSTTGNEESSDSFDTVLMAIGRSANTQQLNLEKLGIKINPNNRKIIGGIDGEVERTELKNIFAIGDVVHGVPELTPVAQKSGQLLARRIQLLLKGSYKQSEYDNTKLEYNDYPTTVFTSLEYSFVGLSEEQAQKRFGKENIEIYHSKFAPLEEQLCDKLDENYEVMQKKVYVKVICDKNDDLRVVGLHYLGPNAGEVMQGFGVAIKLGMKFKDLQRTVGIHPTNAEEFVLLKTTKASGDDFEKHGC